MSVVLLHHVRERLRTDKMIWLTSVRPDGRPHTVPVWFIWEEPGILIFSKPDTQKVLNLRQNSAVMLALDNTQDGQNVVIFEGTAELLGQGEGREVLAGYGEKYHEGLQRIGVTAEQLTQLFSQPIRITITRLVRGQ